ncbi:MAG: hypothetical protein C9356_12390 [Oleiphilus sp.]|nr:MAG: hypothetical protein C9356_12390 [Oleiphilus sp.]
MQLGRCPCCHHRIDLQAIVQDEASSQLLALLAKQPRDVSVPLIQYLGLFRPAKQDLSNTRALKLAKEVLELSGPLSAALERTVDNIQKQRAAQSKGQPLANHNYLKQVLETLGSPVKQTGYQKPPGEVKGEQHKAAEMKKDIPADAKSVLASCGVKRLQEKKS